MVIKTLNLSVKPKLSTTIQLMVNVHHTTKCHFSHFHREIKGEEKQDALLWSVFVRSVSWEWNPRLQYRKWGYNDLGAGREEYAVKLHISSVIQGDDVTAHLPSTFTDNVMLAPFFTFLFVNLSRNLGGTSCSWESGNISDETWWV